MAWHRRHISPATVDAPAGGLRTSVTFVRQDLLWVPADRLRDPYTEHLVPVPFPKAGPADLPPSIYFGPNVLDLVTRGAVELDGAPPVLVWQVRPPADFFETPTKRGMAPHPFKKALCAGGRFLAYADGFLLVEKRSSVSLSTLVYRLALGMHGSADAAARHIGTLASTAWERDLERARALYTVVWDAGGMVADAEIPSELRAQATVSQAVEAALLREACRWLGVDPDTPLSRPRGRPGTRRGEMAMGEVIELTLHADGSVTGRLRQAYAGIPEGTLLATLPLAKLAVLLVAVRDAALHTDVDLLEAYLEAVDPAWRDRLADELAVPPAPSGEDPWTLLGLTPGASLDAIKKAYRHTMRVLHPDTSGLSAWFAQRVNDAYRQLLQEVEHGR
jgi:hypothetical protein